MTSTAERNRGFDQVRDRYPQQVDLRSGGAVELRLMSVRDEIAFLTFARGLSVDDLLYEQQDITDGRVVEEWLRTIRRGQGLTLLAYQDDVIVGQASLKHSEMVWTWHLGDIRIVLAPSVRGEGLGGILAREMFSVGQLLGLEQLSAQMVRDQTVAQTIFHELGFEQVAVLPGFALDAAKKRHDLVIMVHDLTKGPRPVTRAPHDTDKRAGRGVLGRFRRGGG